MREIVLGAEPTLIFQATSQDLSIAALEAEEHNVPFRRKQAQQWNCHQKGGDTVLCSALPRFCCATPSQVRLGNVTHGQPRSRDIVADTGGVMGCWAAERCSEFCIWWYFLESWPSSQDSMLKEKDTSLQKMLGCVPFDIKHWKLRKTVLHDVIHHEGIMRIKVCRGCVSFQTDSSMTHVSH